MPKAFPSHVLKTTAQATNTQSLFGTPIMRWFVSQFDVRDRLSGWLIYSSAQGPRKTRKAGSYTSNIEAPSS